MSNDNGTIFKHAPPKLYFLIFSAIFIVYLAFISFGYHWDSIALAQFAENGFLFVRGWRQHALLTLINDLFYHLCLFFSPSQNALWPLTVLGCFIGALGAALFFAVIEILFSSRSLAFFGALGLAFSFNYWRYSTLVETHILAAFFLIAAVYFLARLKINESKSNVIYAGIFTSLSLLSSEANIVFVPALLIFLLNTVVSKNKKIQAVRYLITIIFFWFVPYFLLGLCALLKDILFDKQIYTLWGALKFFTRWFKSEMYIAPFQAANLGLMAKQNIASLFKGGDQLISAEIVYVAAGILLVVKKQYLVKNYLNILLSSLTACLFFFGTLLFYEPFNLQRYTPLLIFIWLFIGALLRGLFLERMPVYLKAILISGIAVLFISNLVFSMIPKSMPENNQMLQTALLIERTSGENDLVVSRGGDFFPNGTLWPNLAAKYIPYFAHRRLISFMDISARSAQSSEEAEFSDFKSTIAEAIDGGRKVLLLQDALAMNSGKAGYAYPKLYSKLSDFLRVEYSVSKYQEKGSIIIYRLTKK